MRKLKIFLTSLTRNTRPTSFQRIERKRRKDHLRGSCRQYKKSATSATVTACKARCAKQKMQLSWIIRISPSKNNCNGLSICLTRKYSKSVTMLKVENRSAIGMLFWSGKKAIGKAEEELRKGGTLYSLGDIVHNNIENGTLSRNGISYHRSRKH